MERISFNELPKGFITPLLSGQEYVENSGLDLKLIKLIQMRVSMINSCAYCIDMHYKEGIAAGETPLRLISTSVWRETSYYSPKERAVLQFAETLTYLPPNESSEGIHDELSEHFSKEEIALLTLAIIQINSWNRLVRSFGPVAGNYQVKKKAVAQ
ncbi:MAG: carboxymuconolactone decarboxylase family protein [Bacteroidota bacterium]|nr:carboxymuconolactone decarboxylase family protein [Bacteroidota bacterium]